MNKEENSPEMEQLIGDTTKKIEELTASEDLLKPQRLDGESYEDYRLRRIVAKRYVKEKRKGGLVWMGAEGPYNKKRELQRLMDEQLKEDPEFTDKALKD